MDKSLIALSACSSVAGMSTARTGPTYSNVGAHRAKVVRQAFDTDPFTGATVTAAELQDHLDYIDGVQKAQMLVLRALLRASPQVSVQLRTYAEQILQNPPAENLSAVQLEAMSQHLLGLTR